jgi:hypothetical protein
MTQAQGELALKVGGSMLSGMKFLGGMAYDAAVKRGGGATGAGEPPPPAMGINRLFSRSAPTKGEGEEEGEEEEKRRRRYSGEPSVAAAANQVFERERVGGGYYVRVVDLGSLAAIGVGNPRVVLEFQSSRSQPIADLRFSKDGCSLAVIPRDGHLIKVFQLRPAPAVLFGGGGGAASPHDNGASQPGSGLEQSGSVWHLYDLRRGRTSAVVEGVDWAQDGRWLAIGTRNRTVHVFPVNPYGGKVDVKSHMEGRVRNVLAGATVSLSFCSVKRLAENISFLLDTSQDGSNPLGPPAWCQVAAGITFVNFGVPSVINCPSCLYLPQPFRRHHSSKSTPLVADGR